jgi:hypothetical protein
MFKVGKNYQIFSIVEKYIEVMTDYNAYLEKTSLIYKSYSLIDNSTTMGNMSEVLPGYINPKERDRLYTKKIKCKIAIIKSDDDIKYDFIYTTKKELIKLGADIIRNTNLEDYGNPALIYTHSIMLEDYFIDIQSQRDEKLKALGL